MSVHHPQVGTGAEPKARSRKVVLGVAAVAVVVFLLCLFAIRFTVGGSGAVNTPSGLTTSADNGAVKIAWTGVAGADGYQVRRGDAVVVYEGDATTFVDDEAPNGRHRYTVRAVSDGVESASSAASEVTVGSSWGTYTPYVRQFPDLLPQAPDVTGWKDLDCVWTLYGFKDEMGRAAEGSGKPLSRARVACNSPELALAIGWMNSKEAADTIFGRASRLPGIEAVKWRHGTGYYDGDGHQLNLRPDRGDVWIGIGADGATKEQLLELANAMPLE